MLVPDSDVVATAVQTQTPYLASIGRSHVCYDAANDNVLDAFAVWTQYCHNLLSEETTPFINLSLIATMLAAIFQFPSHDV